MEKTGMLKQTVSKREIQDEEVEPDKQTFGITTVLPCLLRTTKTSRGSDVVYLYLDFGACYCRLIVSSLSCNYIHPIPCMAILCCILKYMFGES